MKLLQNHLIISSSSSMDSPVGHLPLVNIRNVPKMLLQNPPLPMTNLGETAKSNTSLKTLQFLLLAGGIKHMSDIIFFFSKSQQRVPLKKLLNQNQAPSWSSSVH